ncbi:MAG: ABC transporter permease subunit [Gemmatimonadota bacterium]
MSAVFLLQLRDNLGSLRLQLSLLILLVLFAANGAVFSARVERQRAETAQIRAADDRVLDGVGTVADAVTPWYRIHSAPLGTEFIADGGNSWTYDSLWITPRSGQTLWNNTVRTTNNWMRRFEVLDWVLVARYAVTFLCLVLAYDAVSGELESGTLRLALACPLSRGRFLAGKFLAHLATVLAATAVGAAVSLVILVVGGAAVVDGALAAAVGGFLLGLAFLAALFLLLAIGVSALARSSAAALVFLVTAWTVLIVVVPQSSYLVAVCSVEPLGPFWEEMRSQRDQAMESLEMAGLTPRPPDLAAADGYAVERTYAREMGRMEEGLDRLKTALDERIFRQYSVARSVNLLSPGFAFQYGLETLLGTGADRVRSFFRQGWDHRRALRDFLRGRDSADPASPHILYLSDFMSRRPLDARLLPGFRQSPLPADERLAAGVVPAAALVFEAGAAFLFALWALRRLDLAGD